MPKQHTKEFITEMKIRLEAEKKRLKRELGQTSDFPEYGRSDEDNATEIADYQATASASNAIIERLRNVQTALDRINDGTYGITDNGETIPEERLRANPAATTIIT